MRQHVGENGRGSIRRAVGFLFVVVPICKLARRRVHHRAPQKTQRPLRRGAPRVAVRELLDHHEQVVPVVFFR